MENIFCIIREVSNSQFQNSSNLQEYKVPGYGSSGGKIQP